MSTMYEFNARDALVLSSLSYFDVLDFNEPKPLYEFVNELLISPKYMDQQRTDLYTLKTLEFLQQFNYERYQPLMITSIFNDNKQSGLVLQVIEDDENAYVCFRGSEMLDEEYQRCGWEDWEDNLDIFLSVTAQQLLALKYVQSHDFHGKKITLLGHSKGGNLALCLSLICSDELLEQIDAVYAFNAPGINPDMLAAYKKRSEDQGYLDKLHLYENENDVVSAFFMHLKEPLIIASSYDDRNLQQLCHAHQVYGYKMDQNEFVFVTQKSRMPKLMEAAINNIFMKQSKERRAAFINDCLSYLKTNHTMPDIYPLFVKRIEKHTQIFNDISYNKLKIIEFDELIDRFKQELHMKAMTLTSKIFDVKSAVGELLEKMNIK